LAAAFGLIAALTTVPVSAEEAPAPIPVPLSKEERVKKDLEQLSKEEVGAEFAAARGANDGGGAVPAGGRKKKSVRPKVEKPKAKEEAGFSLSLPSLPSFSVPESKAEAPKKVIISPADELDDDEKPLGAQNLPLFFAIFLGPSFIYIVFYVLGSLDII